MKIRILSVVTLALMGFQFSGCEQVPSEPTAYQKILGEDRQPGGEGMAAAKRSEWDRMRLADPATGEIPVGIRERELAFAASLQQASSRKRDQAQYDWRGPWNVGGRTRAMAVDSKNENVILAAGTSGGVWRSTDQGQSWNKTTGTLQHHSVSCIVQDSRPGHENNWWIGTGEAVGNSANASFSAPYLGTGVYHSSDSGKSWNLLTETTNETPQTEDPWDLIWNIAIQHGSGNDSTYSLIYAATQGHIFQGQTGGFSWVATFQQQGITSVYADIASQSNGVLYATMSNEGSNSGILRSPSGIDWVNINPPFMPSNYRRIVIEPDPNDVNIVYFLASTPGSGKITNVFFGGTEGNSLWKYTYVSGDGTGAGGIWEDLSANLPDGLGNFGNFNAQGSYNMMISVKPGDPNTIFIGGTNLYRSADGFTTPNNISWIGGYEPFTFLPFFEIYENHHPDQHDVAFLPSNPDAMISANDGGVFITSDCMAPTVSWTSLNNGYNTTQFYTVAVDHQSNGDQTIIGGTQDNGSWWTNSTDATTHWTMPSTGDGSFCAIAGGGSTYYFSRQNAKVLKMELDNAGIPTAFTRIDPIGGSGYLFINPFILDPSDDNIMYLLNGTRIARNDSLSSIVLDNQYDTISTGWFQFSNILSNTATALAASVSNPPHRLYVGTNSKRIFRYDDAHTGDPARVEITNDISSGVFTNCIAVDPRDADKVMVVYSNYNVYSLHYSENGGTSWTGVAGNLEGEQPVGAPPGLGIGDGPSCRWVSIIPVSDGTVYLLGTSVGLFATDTLMGDSTVWLQQSKRDIGNVVVDMIDYRESDGFVAIGTHGNGIYSTHITSKSDIELELEPNGWPTGVEEDAAIHVPKVYPNPANEQVVIELYLDPGSNAELVVLDLYGRQVATQTLVAKEAGLQGYTLPTVDLSSGLYFYSIAIQGKTHSGRLVVKH